MVACRIGAPALTPNNAMEEPIIQIQVYDKREKMTGNLYVVDLGDNRYRMTENDIFIAG